MLAPHNRVYSRLHENYQNNAAEADGDGEAPLGALDGALEGALDGAFEPDA